MASLHLCIILKLALGVVNPSITHVKYNPKRIPIHDFTLLNGNLNDFQLIQKYFGVRRLGNLGHDRFFLGVNQVRKNDVSTFFKAQPIGRNTIPKTVKQSLLVFGNLCRRSEQLRYNRWITRH